MADEPIVVTREAREVAVHAVNVARGEGCDCVPEVEMSPTPEGGWFPLVLHDETCSHPLVTERRPDNLQP